MMIYVLHTHVGIELQGGGLRCLSCFGVRRSLVAETAGLLLEGFLHCSCYMEVMWIHEWRTIAVIMHGRIRVWLDYFFLWTVKDKSIYPFFRGIQQGYHSQWASGDPKVGCCCPDGHVSWRKVHSLIQETDGKLLPFGLGAQGLMMMMMMMMMLVVGSIWKPIGTFGFGKEDPSHSWSTDRDDLGWSCYL